VGSEVADLLVLCSDGGARDAKSTVAISQSGFRLLPASFGYSEYGAEFVDLGAGRECLHFADVFLSVVAGPCTALTGRSSYRVSA
jgi:hypothetical protein